MVHVMRHQDLNRFNLPGTSARNYHLSGPRPPKREPPRRQRLPETALRQSLID